MLEIFVFCFFVLFDILGFLSLFRWKNGKGTQKLYDEYETEFPQSLPRLPIPASLYLCLP